MAFTKEEIQKIAAIAMNEYYDQHKRPKTLYHKILGKYYFIKTRIKDAYLVLIGKNIAVNEDYYNELDD